MMIHLLKTLTANWAFNPGITLSIVLVGCLYAIGVRSSLSLVPRGHRLRHAGWRTGLFYLSLVLVFLALESPIDTLSQSLMWVHMIQHLMLIMVVPPLAILGDPALPLLRGIPVATRRRLLGSILDLGSLRVVGTMARRLLRPVPAFIISTTTLWLWHWPALYNWTLRDEGIHILEHLSFLCVGTLFWWQIIDQTHYKGKLGYAGRSLYVFATAVQNHFLAITLAFAPAPLYAYRILTSRPGNISALTDQQLAGGIMWVPGMTFYGAAFSICLYKWLSSQNLPIGASEAEEKTRADGSLRPRVIG